MGFLIPLDVLNASKLCMDVYDPLIETPGKFFKSKDTDAELYVALLDDTAVVCARGSDHIKDWMLNFMMELIPFTSATREKSEAKVHTGFMIQWMSVKEGVFAELDRITSMDECTNVLFTGHSSGAALASLACHDYMPLCQLSTEVITFGSPRFCNRELQEIFDSDVTCTRVVNDMDAVTLAPLKSIGYVHVGKVLHMRNDDIDRKELCLWEKLWWTISNILKPDFGISDHFIGNYVDELEYRMK